LRRLVTLALVAAALSSVGSAAAAFHPVIRKVGDLTVPRVVAGKVVVPPAATHGQTRVIVTLDLPPLAAAFGRDLYVHGATRHLEVSSASSRAYLQRVQTAQRQAVAELHRELPQAQVSRRFQIVVDGLTVTLPVKQLPKLMRLGFVNRVYPSLRYSMTLNDSPGVIEATQLEAATGAMGDGTKIGIVDDGIDQKNTFFNPAGFQYPAGFPKGDTAYTTPKVIVARTFPGPGTGKAARLPLDPKSSFHGTHVAGIAAGDSGTTAPAGPDHPGVAGLSGLAPRAWLGNYRVFSQPSPFGGDTAESPEIVAAFEQAVADGMNVINFSGGGDQTEPSTDILIQAVDNTAAAGVVPVISAGNDRDTFGLGSVGSPSTAPAAISVAAVSNAHVFAPVMTVTEPTGMQGIPVTLGTGGIPSAWSSVDQKVVDVETILGTDGKPVEPHLCGPANDLEAPTSTLPKGSLAGAIALVSRGNCTFASKADRAHAAGAVGMILVDNRPGEANGVGVRLSLPDVMISDLDGANLRAAMAGTDGIATIRVGTSVQQIQTGRSGVPTSFSAGGPTPFGHDLKPDISAPGGAILSSTVTTTIGEPFAVFDGTSMSAPHITGAAAVLLQLHPHWSPDQVKSALMSTAGPDFADTARTQEASVLLEGAGLARLVDANDPRIFTSPQSFSFHDLDVNHGAARVALLATVDDAGGGFGTWNVELHPQAASAGATIDLPDSITIPANGETFLPVAARAAADAAAGDDYGFIVLRQGDVTRRIPYYFSVTRPQLEGVPVRPIQPLQSGTTLQGQSHVDLYRFPTAPFGPSSTFSGLPPESQPGAEQVYSVKINSPLVNFGASVLLSSPGSEIDPWLLGSLDENDVQGFGGIPVNTNSFMFDYRADVGAVSAGYPLEKTFYIVVDSNRDPSTGKSLAGRYELRSWVNDLTPPAVVPVTKTVAAGRPTLVARVTDSQSGVDPLSLVVGYGNALVGAALFDPVSGLAVFPLPSSAPRLKTGKRSSVFIASDFEEAKNEATLPGPNTMPNTTFDRLKLTVVNHPTVSWALPDAGRCVAKNARLLVASSSTKRLRSAQFYDETHRIATSKVSLAGLIAVTWKTGRAAKGTHDRRVVVTDASGRTATASRAVKVCR
jgi:minor extracellular serine protease Vpr